MARTGNLPKRLQVQTNLISRDDHRKPTPSTPLDSLSRNTTHQHFDGIKRTKCTRSGYIPLRSQTQNTLNSHRRTSSERNLSHFMKAPLLVIFRIMILAPC